MFNWSVQELEQILNQSGISFQALVYFELGVGLLTAATYGIVGCLIYARKKADWFGLYMAVVLVLYGTLTSSQVYIIQDKYPEISVWFQPLSTIPWVTWFLSFYLFPDGHFSPRWARWFAYLMLAGFGINAFVNRGNTPPAWLAGILLPCILAGLFSQVYRYRYASGPIERQQTKWVALAIVVLVGFLTLGLLSIYFPAWTDIHSPFAIGAFAYNLLSYPLSLAVPLTIGVAMLRYRLWDIDIIIRRTLQYSLVTGVLALVFFGGVTIFQAIFSSITGEQSNLAIALSTLAIAALFNPLRKRVQAFIDKRFFRQGYNALKTLESFAAYARNEVELSRLSAELVRAASDTLKPDKVSLWIKKT